MGGVRKRGWNSIAKTPHMEEEEDENACLPACLPESMSAFLFDFGPYLTSRSSTCFSAVRLRKVAAAASLRAE